jgi:hypothetical protein
VVETGAVRRSSITGRGTTGGFGHGFGDNVRPVSLAAASICDRAVHHTCPLGEGEGRGVAFTLAGVYWGPRVGSEPYTSWEDVKKARQKLGIVP